MSVESVNVIVNGTTTSIILSKIHFTKKHKLLKPRLHYYTITFLKKNNISS